MLRETLIETLNQLLSPGQYKDYCPNGLQIQGSVRINKIITGVSINQQLIDMAVGSNVQAIIVHHGIFWNRSTYPLVGVKYERVAKLIKNDINLLAYHLPLDNHPVYGNNIQLANLLDIEVKYQTGEQNLIWVGELSTPILLSQFAANYEVRTGHKPICFGDTDKLVRKIAWCTGGADSMFEEAIALGVDLFVTGEIKEPVMHLALESSVAFMAGGHYTTERYGIKALTGYLRVDLGLDAEFIDIYNPI